MNDINTIRNNSIFSFLSIASRLIPNVLIFWVLARYFGPSTFGKFSYSHTLANTFLLFADFGFDLLIMTEIALNKDNAKKVFQQFFWIKIFLALVSLFFMFLFVLIRGGGFESVLLGILFAFYMLFNTIANFFVASFKGFERLDYDAKVSLVMNGFLFLSSIVLFILNQNIFLIAASYVVSRIVGLAYSIKITHSILPGLSYKIVFDEISSNLKKAFTFGVLILANNFLFQLDTILLGIFKNDYQVGLYQAVKNLLLVPFIIPGVVFSAFLPTLTRIYKEDFESWISLNSILFKIIFWLNLLISAMLFAYPEQIIGIIYNTKNYTSAIPILRLFSIILFLRSTSDYLGVMLISSSRKKIHIYTSLASILLCILASVLIIPIYSALGAGYVYLIIISFIISIYSIVNYKLFIKKVFNYRYLLLIIVAVITAIIAKHYSFINMFIGIPLIFIAFIIYATIFFFTENEKKNLLALRTFFDFNRN